LAPNGTGPQVAGQLIREFLYLCGAVTAKDGTCGYLIMPASDTECFQVFLEIWADKYSRQPILLFVAAADRLRLERLDPVTVLGHVGAVRDAQMKHHCVRDRGWRHFALAQQYHLNALSLRRRDFPPQRCFQFADCFLLHLTIRPLKQIAKASHIALELLSPGPKQPARD
jgi:hypothetical protein